MGDLKLVDCKDVSHKLLVGLHKSWLSGKYASHRHSVPNEPVSVNFCPLNFFFLVVVSFVWNCIVWVNLECIKR